MYLKLGFTSLMLFPLHHDEDSHSSLQRALFIFSSIIIYNFGIFFSFSFYSAHVSILSALSYITISGYLLFRNIIFQLLNTLSVIMCRLQNLPLLQFGHLMMRLIINPSMKILWCRTKLPDFL